MMQVAQQTASNEELGKVDASFWQQIPSQNIPLVGVPIGMQPTSFIRNNWKDQVVGKISNVNVKASHNGEYIAIHMEWADATQNIDTDDNDHFPDGAAIMFPLKGDAPLVTMGSNEKPVNAWHWRADRPNKANNNVAAGFGTSRVTSDINIKTSSRYRNGHWQVVFLRKLQPDNITTNSVQFILGQQLSVAFSVWEGSNGERAGLKAFSPQWHTLTTAKNDIKVAGA